jgi:hypothetical protein
MESRMDHLEKTFQSKMTLIEGNNDALQNELAALRQKELQQDQENKQLRDELTKLKVATEDSINNDLNYDSSDNEGDDNTDTTDVGVMQGSDDALQKELAALKQRELDHQKENQQLKEKLAIMETGIEDDANNDLNYDSSDNDGDDNTDTADVGVMQGNNDALQNELAALKQKELEQHEENQRLKERLARMETDMQDNANNDLNYDSSDNESSHENDTNYDTERYTSEEDEEEEEEEENKTAANAQKNKMHDNLVKKYADPNYNSSDKEDPKNDIYLD